MDDLIYEEFKGTGNSEVILSRKLAERRIFPSIDPERSSTRREELLLDEESLARIWTLRRMLDMLGGGAEAIEPVIQRIMKTRNNKEFLTTLNKDTF
jgi:transcription termination factor Rho